MSEFYTNVSNDKICTPAGYEDFYGVQRIHRDFYWHLITEQGQELKCSVNHPIKNNDGVFIKANEYKRGDVVQTDVGSQTLVYSEFVNEPIYLYDFIDVGERKELYTNGIVSHNCEFLGSTNTLIHATKLRALTFRTPLYEKNNFKCYHEPEPDRSYVIVVDTSRGLGLDYSAFIVFDITEYPYRGVGKYRSKDISPLLYPDVIYNAARKYNDAFVLVEINDIGEQVANILYNDFEYENIFRTSQKGGIQYITSGFSGGRAQLGVRTSKTVKRIGCSVLKDVVEQDKLIFEDYEYVNELCNFVQVKESFQAEQGFHDDIVMCTVLFSWLIRQDYFKDLTNKDLRKKLYADNQQMIEDDVLPFGFIDDGSGDDGIIDIDVDRLGWSLPSSDTISDKW